MPVQPVKCEKNILQMYDWVPNNYTTSSVCLRVFFQLVLLAQIVAPHATWQTIFKTKEIFQKQNMVWHRVCFSTTAKRQNFTRRSP